MKTGLSLPDAQAIVRLLGEVSSVGGGIDSQRQFLMDGLCDIVEAGCWVWTTACRFAPGEVPLYAGFLKGGFTEERFARYLKALEHPDIAILNEALTKEFHQKRTHLTRLREEIDVGNRFLESAAYPLWCAAGIDKVIMSLRPGTTYSHTGIALYRSPECAAFTARESRIVHIVLSEVPWLYESTITESSGTTVTSLSPRQRITLNLLLEGQTRKQIAAHLELSPHTIDGYVKEVFRFFHVHSQPELIAKFRNGDGGDQP